MDDGRMGSGEGLAAAFPERGDVRASSGNDDDGAPVDLILIISVQKGHEIDTLGRS